MGATVVGSRPPRPLRDPLIKTLRGAPVADAYRGPETADSAETRAWVDAQNALTRSVLDVPARDELVRELTGHFNYARTLSAERRAGRYFFSHNPGLLNQPLLYMQDGEAGAARVLLDPNTFSADGTIAVTATLPSPDGVLVAYALSEHGSDRQVVRIRRVEDAKDLEDIIQWVKFASIAWTRDRDGFYYLRFPVPGTVPAEDEQYFGRIYFHRLGEVQADDVLVFQKPEMKEAVPMVHVTADDRYAVITVQRGASDDSEIHLVDRLASTPPRPLFTGFDAAYDFIEGADQRLYFRTTRGAPRGRVVAIDVTDPSTTLHEIVPESPHRLSSAVMSREGLVCVYLENASDRLRRFDRSGPPLGDIELPGIGSIVSIGAHTDRDETVIVYTSFVDPPDARVYREDGFFRLKPEATKEPEGIKKIASGFRLQAEDPAYLTTQVW